VAAPIVPPSAMMIRSAARLIRAPAEMARLFTNSTVRMRLPSRVSRIRTAASTRPPNVLTSRITAAAPAAAASSRTRRTKGASPRSIIPSIDAMYTTGRVAGATWVGQSASMVKSPPMSAPEYAAWSRRRRWLAAATASMIG
jgi:hypothetical protein